ncbi:MAG TPA: sugar phosphate isomerase/epimerase family protein [Phycisphaerae bacterium]|nr:sugar phosphate isomerase/epimerase family protein [Phycisphaerae bacterium]
MWTISNMAWRIGEILAIEEQIEWTARGAFGGVSFHAHAGEPGSWQGVDPAAWDARRRARLRERIAGFKMCEIHAPFGARLQSASLPAVVNDLMPVLDLARDVGASIVTVHAGLPASDADEKAYAWREWMNRLSAKAAECGVVIGLELVSGFELVRKWRLPNIGVTLDVGHMYVIDAGAPLKPFGSIGQAVRSIGDNLVHLHVHDVDGMVDHNEIGTGCVDFDDLLKALKEIGYRGALCLEMHPDRVTPEGMVRSRKWLEERAHVLGLA